MRLGRIRPYVAPPKKMRALHRGLRGTERTLGGGEDEKSSRRLWTKCPRGDNLLNHQGQKGGQVRGGGCQGKKDSYHKRGEVKRALPVAFKILENKRKAGVNRSHTKGTKKK